MFCYEYQYMKIFPFTFVLSEKKVLVLALLAAASALAGALIGQYGFSLYPCELCMFQRYPYAAVIVIAVLSLVFLRSVRLRRYALMLCALLFVIDAAIAVYHSGVELDIFTGPTACSASNHGEQTLEQMRAEIMGAALVTCKQAMAYFLGLSMAMWNVLFASAMSIFMVTFLVKTKRHGV